MGAEWLTAAPTQTVFAAIAAGGFEARAVGGVVRNALLGIPVTDIDLATDAPPRDVMRLARAAHLGVVETGLKHGTVTVLAAHHTFEVTTLRTDVESHGRHATVVFTADWTADARRRDFTMNALYCNADGRVFDPLGGYPDLLARRVRFIGDASERIREDYLRILRFFRFTAQYSTAPPDAAGLRALVRERAGLAQLSAERIRQELVRLLIAPQALAAVRSMQEHGILAEILPAAPRPTLLARLIEIEVSERCPPDAMLRLGALAVSTPEDARRLSQRLRLSREEQGRLELCARAQAYLQAPPDETAARALLYRREPIGYCGLIALSWARNLSAATSDASWRQALTLPNRWTPSKLPVDGAAVIAAGVPAGPAVGEALRTLESWWIEQDFDPDRDALLDRLRTLKPA